jgi:hypothetical protein
MMQEDEQLGELLGDALRTLVEDLEPSAALIARIDAMTEAPPRRWRLRSPGSLRRKLLIAAPSSAFAVLGNGDVRVTIDQLIGVSAANQQLSQLNIHNMIVVPMTDSCSNTDMTYMAARLDPPPHITLTPTTVNADSTIVLAAKQIAPSEVEMAIGHFSGQIPTCVSSHGTGPGMGSFHP